MTTTTLPQLELVVSIFPVAGEPEWDPLCQEWVLTDSDGISYCATTPSECYAQFQQALHYLVEHYRKCLSDAELPRYSIGQP